MKKTLSFILILTILFAASVHFEIIKLKSVERIAEPSGKDLPISQGKRAAAPEETFVAAGNSHPTISIEINPMIDLNFKTKNEIYALRSAYVLQHEDLKPRDYRPSEAVFGQIVDKKPWWGILGLSYYGPGQMSIEGAAEESRFLANPYLLVGLDIGYAMIVDDKSLAPIPLYPQPLELTWNIDGSLGKVKYDVSSFWVQLRAYHFPLADQKKLDLIAYNARDFGFHYLSIDLEESTNVRPTAASNEPLLIRQFIHCGGSCGYPGGCNNMSPSQPELGFLFLDLPATAYIKLWRNKPLNTNSKADTLFVIEMF